MSVASTKIQRPRPCRAGDAASRARTAPLQALGRSSRCCCWGAPAGYGKTALLARALEQLPAGHGAAWVALDPGDDLHRLLQCLWQALEPFDLPWRTSPEGLAQMAGSADPRQQQQAADALVNTLEAGDLAHGVIVLDDLHHVDDAEALAFLDRLLLRLGERWTLAIATRQEPALRLARLRAMGLLTELRGSDLQFSRDEALALLQPAGLEPAAAEALHQRTQGWVAGLRLALGGARGGAPGSAIDRAAFDYLSEEVLQQLDPALREFLLRTSVLQELDVERCRALTGDAQCWLHLDALERMDLFVSVVGEQPRALKLHGLFRDALTQRMQLERRDEWRRCWRAPRPSKRPGGAGAGRRRSARTSVAAAKGQPAADVRRRRAHRCACASVSPSLPAAAPSCSTSPVRAKWRLWRNAEADQHRRRPKASRARRRGRPGWRRGGASAMLAGIGRSMPRGARPKTAAARRRRRGAHPCARRHPIALERARAAPSRHAEALRCADQARQPRALSRWCRRRA